jgi:rhamnogalacturonyl hydrolase YesR
MRKLFLLILLIPGFCMQAQADEDIMTVVDRGLQRSLKQSLIMARSLEHEPQALPRYYDKKGLHRCDYKNWVSGFFPGVLWYLYEDAARCKAPEKAQLEYFARLYTGRVDSAKHIKWTHDLGFMLNSSYGNGYRLTGDTVYLAVLAEGCRSLATRFNEKVGCIQSWGKRNGWQYPVIIDNMLNLEFLVQGSRLTGEKRYSDMAVSHALKTMENHFRSDYSCYHVVSYLPETGGIEAKKTWQGLADSSAWARGQAWALYGYTMMYRETGRKEFLELAKKVANYIATHPRLPEDKIPYWDFDDPLIPNTYRDASAGSCMASAFIELSLYDKQNARRWLTVGFAGHQPRMSEKYISTGSEYMCMAAFMALGLPPTDAFWADPWQEWTNLKAWRGTDIGADHALRDKNSLYQ